jgi:hypothetical protein
VALVVLVVLAQVVLARLVLAVKVMRAVLVIATTALDSFLAAVVVQVQLELTALTLLLALVVLDHRLILLGELQQVQANTFQVHIILLVVAVVAIKQMAQ